MVEVASTINTQPIVFEQLKQLKILQVDINVFLDAVERECGFFWHHSQSPTDCLKSGVYTSKSLLVFKFANLA